MSITAGPLFGFSVKHIAEVCQVDITTARRWKRGAICPPIGAIALLNGDLGFLDPLWSGWKLCRGALFSPESWEITKNDVLATPLLRHQLAAYQSENRALKRDLADALVNRLEEQPRPEDWDVQIIMA